MGRSVRLALMVVACLVIVPAVASAQASITGVVRDTSGAVLPGVTVEAASPALIERLRSVVTDGTGQYRIVDLRPGTYVVTFTLPGFATVRREGVELTGSFVASVNAELRVGALEETVTVTGATPTVDVQSTVRQRVLDQEVLDVLPVNRTPTFAATLLPSVTRSTGRQDVGGLSGEGSSSGNSLLVHGVQTTPVFNSGMPNLSAVGTTHNAYNLAAYQEVVVDIGGVGAEGKEGGVRINLIPKDGGNTFNGSFLGAFASPSMQGSNFTPDLQARGLPTPGSIKQPWDVNPAFGGPIKQDRLWFHATGRYSRAWSYVPLFFNKNAGNPDAWTYEPDTSRKPAANEYTIENFNGRITWQATPRNKLAVSYDQAVMCECPRNLAATTSPEASASNYVTSKPPTRQLLAGWTVPVTNRLLFEANTYRLWAGGGIPSEPARTRDCGELRCVECGGRPVTGPKSRRRCA